MKKKTYNNIIDVAKLSLILLGLWVAVRGMQFLTTILDLFSHLITNYKNVSEEFQFLIFLMTVWVFMSVADVIISTVKYLPDKKK